VRFGSTLGAGPGAASARWGDPRCSGIWGTLAFERGLAWSSIPAGAAAGAAALALNVLSSSPWMAAGRAHYSSLVLPFITIGRRGGTTAPAGRPCSCGSPSRARNDEPRRLRAGRGWPAGWQLRPALVTEHARRADTLAKSLPQNAVVQCLVGPGARVSRRRVSMWFPAVLDAEYVFVRSARQPGAGPAPATRSGASEDCWPTGAGRWTPQMTACSCSIRT